jgi:galactonate dehydratase
MPFIEKGLVNYARVDICNVGGFTEAMKVAGWAEAHYIDLMPHNPLGPICTAACVHLGAAVPNFAWMEDWCAGKGKPSWHENPASQKLFPVRHQMDGVVYPVPPRTSFGLGVEFNEAYAQELEREQADAFEYSSPPFLRKKDGSWTNW